MKKILLLFLLTSSIAYSQGVLKGTVLEHGSNQPLIGAYILLKESLQGTIVQTDGTFVIPGITPGTHQVEISFIGFITQTLSVEISNVVQTMPIVYLKPGGIQLADVVISSNADHTINTLAAIDIKLRPTNTSQDILRMVPGLFIAQHAGGGKAEQIFLRGFDIDHGTDINLEVDGLPVNMVSHAHGQGYSDLHFLIPELVQFADFDKGPYFADKGDFATAGYVSFQTKNSLDHNFAKAEGGQFGSFRGVTGFNFIPSQATNRTGYIASEFFRSDGYFESPQNFNRLNLTAKYSTRINESNNITIGGSFFNSSWDASGQIPERAIQRGDISRFGSIDDTEGGETARINFYVKHGYQFLGGSTFDQQAYAIHYNFNLFSNFTFYLNDAANGDQIQQKESRMIYGYKINYHSNRFMFGKQVSTHAGASMRYDNINDIALSNTVKREFLTNVQRGDLSEANINGFLSETIELSERWSINGALRFDYFVFGYKNQLTDEASREHAHILSPKLNVQYQINSTTQLYLRTGSGFHSNDARAVVEQRAKEILPRAYGVDLGMDTKLHERLLLHAAIWRLDLDQEFVYVGDAGIVEPSGETQRQGVDLSVRYQIAPWLFVDADITLADPKAKHVAKGEDHIPLAPKLSSIGGLTFRCKNGLNGSLRYRYLDHRAANENNSVVADGYCLLDGVINYTSSKFEIGLSVENVLNAEWKEAQFNTESRLMNESESVSEIHFTPGTPFFAKLKLSLFF